MFTKYNNVKLIQLNNSVKVYCLDSDETVGNGILHEFNKDRDNVDISFELTRSSRNIGIYFVVFDSLKNVVKQSLLENKSRFSFNLSFKDNFYYVMFQFDDAKKGDWFIVKDFGQKENDKKPLNRSLLPFIHRKSFVSSNNRVRRTTLKREESDDIVTKEAIDTSTKVDRSFEKNIAEFVLENDPTKIKLGTLERNSINDREIETLAKQYKEEKNVVERSRIRHEYYKRIAEKKPNYSTRFNFYAAYRDFCILSKSKRLNDVYTKIFELKLEYLREKTKLVTLANEEIVATVALPMYMARESYWLALEGLVRQKGVRFGWELVILEEITNCVGLGRIREYSEKLKAAGCCRIKYCSIENWITLSEKWLILADMACETSEVFLLQAADCFNQPYRLTETYELIAKGDWVQSKKGTFLNIKTWGAAIYDHETQRSRVLDGVEMIHPCALSMAVRTDLVRRIRAFDFVVRSVDYWIFKNCERLNGKMNVIWNSSRNWLRSLDTDGLNKLSKNRASKIDECKAPFRPYEYRIEDYFDADILERLRSVREIAEKNSYVK